MEITRRKEGESSNGGSWGKRNRTLRGENINRTRKPCCRGTRKKGNEPEMVTSLGSGCGEREWRKLDVRKGKKARGKHTGNKSRETCGGPVPIEEQNGDISHVVNRRGHWKSNLSRGILPHLVQKKAKGP